MENCNTKKDAIKTYRDLKEVVCTSNETFKKSQNEKIEELLHRKRKLEEDSKRKIEEVDEEIKRAKHEILSNLESFSETTKFKDLKDYLDHISPEEKLNFYKEILGIRYNFVTNAEFKKHDIIITKDGVDWDACAKVKFGVVFVEYIDNYDHLMALCMILAKYLGFLNQRLSLCAKELAENHDTNLYTKIFDQINASAIVLKGVLNLFEEKDLAEYLSENEVFFTLNQCIKFGNCDAPGRERLENLYEYCSKECSLQKEEIEVNEDLSVNVCNSIINEILRITEELNDSDIFLWDDSCRSNELYEYMECYNDRRKQLEYVIEGNKVIIGSNKFGDETVCLVQGGRHIDELFEVANIVCGRQ